LPLPIAVLRAMGMSQHDIDSWMFALMMTGVGETEMLAELSDLYAGNLARQAAALLTDEAGALRIGGWAVKSINLPAWRNVTVDVVHIAERHIPGGPLTAGRTIFP